MPTVLIVDDSKFQRQTIKSSLAKHGYDITEAGNGRDGISMISESSPDAALMDVNMPDMDGITALKVLKKKGVKVPVIIVTANIQDTVKKECMDLGAVGFINKPVKGASLDELLNILKNYI